MADQRSPLCCAICGVQGLGKTVQMAALLSLLFHSGRARRVLLVLPVSLTPNWTKELRSWCPSIPLHFYLGTPRKREQHRIACLHTGGILLTTYGMVASQQGAVHFTSPDNRWDALILDEGHRIKNPDIHLTRTVKRIPCDFRVILSGTPIQNDLSELWCLMDFACSGRLLGEAARFREEWSEPIGRGYDRLASREEKHRAQQLTQQLQHIIAPHMLRREKKEVMKRQEEQQEREVKRDGGAETALVGAVPSTSSSFSFLSVQKNDVIVWIYLTEAQASLYSSFISSPTVKAALNSTRSPLAALTILKKICVRALHTAGRSMCQCEWVSTVDSSACLLVVMLC